MGVIACLEQETGKKCFDTFRRSLDHEHTSIIEYDDLHNNGSLIVIILARIGLEKLSEQFRLC